MAYFPMFIDLSNKNCLVVGGGNIAYQKVKVLSEFGADITVVSEDIDYRISELSKKLKVKSFEEEDIKNMSLVVAATDDEKLNHRISLLCKNAGIPVNAVDQKDDCTFIFPAIVKEKELVAAISSGGSSPLMAQGIKKKVSEILSEELGEINDGLGACREYVKSQVNDIDKRKAVFKRIYEESINENKMISNERIQEIIQEIIADEL